MFKYFRVRALISVKGMKSIGMIRGTRNSCCIKHELDTYRIRVISWVDIPKTKGWLKTKKTPNRSTKNTTKANRSYSYRLRRSTEEKNNRQTCLLQYDRPYESRGDFNNIRFVAIRLFLLGTAFQAHTRHKSMLKCWLEQKEKENDHTLETVIEN